MPSVIAVTKIGIEGKVPQAGGPAAQSVGGQMRFGEGGPRVLLVEDDEGDALLVRACLDEAGFADEDILWTRTLQEATAALVRRRPRCVLLDLGLPDAEGLAALTETVRESPDTPIIVLTGRHDQAGTEALALGAQDYLVKDDITADLLSRSIRYAVERKRAQRISQQLRESQLNSAAKSRLERGLLATPLLRSHRVRCSTYYQPGRDHAVLGGDFFDVIETPDHRVRVLIGDVMGHGPDEAAIGVNLRVAWRTLVLAGTPDTQMLPTLSTLLAAETGGEFGFVTASDVTIEVDNSATFRVAGHPAPLHHINGKTSYLELEVGPPLGLESVVGMRPGWALTGGWPQTRIELGADSSLIFYTDGLLESFADGADTSSVGIDELVSAVDACASGGGAVTSWIPSLVGSAPNQSVDDTAVVVVTTGPSVTR